MSKHAVAVIALAALALYGATSLAHQRTATATQITMTGNSNEVTYSDTCAGWPRPTSLPCRLVQVGRDSNTRGLKGAVNATITVTGHPSRNTYTYQSTGEYFGRLGTLKTSSDGSYTVHADGTFVQSDQGHVTGGTGIWSGVTGTTSASGSNASRARIFTTSWNILANLPEPMP